MSAFNQATTQIRQSERMALTDLCSQLTTDAAALSWAAKGGST